MTTRVPCIIPVGPYAGRIGYWLTDVTAWCRVPVFLPGLAESLFYFRRDHLSAPTERQLVERLKSIKCPVNASPDLATRSLLQAEEAFIVSLPSEFTVNTEN